MTHKPGHDAKFPYGRVTYADTGFQPDGIHRYPLDRESHVRAAWSYVNMPKNAAKYTADQLDTIKRRIKEAAEKYGIEITEDESDAGKGTMGMATADEGTALVAGAGPLSPPANWFSDPGLQAPTRLTITDDGRVYGHLAQWRVCHVGVGNACVVAPKSRTEYGLFKQGTVLCDDGTQLSVGKITLGTAHANAQWGVMPTRDHYDNTGWAAAVVNVGEDRHGIWVNGALTSTMTPERIAEFRAAALSGDWRTVNGHLELIAALAVNNPGFPIYREQGGHAFSLQAVGVLDQDEEISGEFSMDGGTSTTEPVAADDEQQARMARLAAIEADFEDQEQQKRLAQLAVLDEERDKFDAPKARDIRGERVKMLYDAEFTKVDNYNG